jgi:glucose-6-phosphate dehydrogenase assembly protein OpcA
MAESVNADRILADLHKLWAGLAGDPATAGGHAVLRACAMTLIVTADEGEDAVSIGQVIADVMREHPNRAIVVRVRASNDPLLEYRVTAQCWMPFGTRQQICCEQIEITVSDASLPGLMPVLLAIAAPDLPLVVWCRNDRLAQLPGMGPLFEKADKLLIDSATFPDARAALGHSAAEGERGRRISDLAWTRVTRWRELVAQVFEDPARRSLVSEIKQVSVLYAGDSPPVTAYYLAGWVMACASAENLEARFEAVPPVIGGIEGIVLTGNGHRISLRRANGTAVLIEMDSLLGCSVVPLLTDAELLGSELAVSSRDPVFEKSLAQAARIARG